MDIHIKESLGSRHPALTILRRLSAQVDRPTDILIDSKMDREINRQMDIHIKEWLGSRHPALTILRRLSAQVLVQFLIVCFIPF